MSHLHGSSLIAGAHVFGGGGLGTLAESIPATGERGAGYAYKGLSFPADNGKEIRGQVIAPPSSGAFFAYNDTSYTLIGAADGPYWFDWKLWVDGVPSAVDIGYGAGIARVFLQVGPAYSVVSATTDDAVFSGESVVSGSASSVFSSINATTDDAVFSGLSRVFPSCRINATTENAVFSGLTVGGGSITYSRAPSGSGYRRTSESYTRPQQINTVRH